MMTKDDNIKIREKNNTKERVGKNMGKTP